MKENKINGQTIWGASLFLMGAILFFAIPEKMTQIAAMEQFASVLPYIRFCLYFTSVFLAAAGIKKIYGQYKSDKP